MPETAGNWSFMLELRAGSNMTQQKGVLLDSIKMAGKKPAETMTEYYERTTTNSSPSSASTTSLSTIVPTVPTTKNPVESAGIFGTKGAEIFMIILVVIFAICLIALAVKYAQLQDKLKEYRLHGGETDATGYNNNPAYDNPMYNAGHRSAERYTQRGSIPYNAGNNNNTQPNN